MIDIVIPLGKGSPWDNNELRYSLRSIEKHLKKYNRIYIVGEKPDWIQNVIHVPHVESGHASQNIIEKVKTVCKNCGDLSAQFMFWNDDFFLLKDVDACKYPYYHRGDLYKSIPKNKNNWYQEYILETIKELESKDLGTLNFDVHTPIIYTKEGIRMLNKYFDFRKKLVIKSTYCNTFYNEANPAIEIEDCKISGRMARWRLDQKIKDKHIFSIADKCLEPYPGESESAVKVLIQELYPDKSIYER